MTTSAIFFIAQFILFLILSLIGLLVSFAIISIPGALQKLTKEIREIKEEFKRL